MELAVDGNGSLIPFKIINNDTSANDAGASAGFTKKQVAASLAANPEASRGAYGVAGSGVSGTPIAGTAAMPAQYGGGDTNSGGAASAPAGTGLSGTAADNALGLYGLPSDVQSKVDSIFQNTSDVNTAAALALAYIRGTTWYQQTYPGIQAGISNGTVNNEADYRQYLNQINQLYQNYYGRSVTGDEIANYLSAGRNPTYVGNLLQGQTYAQTNRGDLQYLSGAFGNGQMSDQQLTALGQEQAGIDTPLGQLQQRIIQRAQQIQQRLNTGRIANPSLSLGGQGVYAPTLAGTKQPSTGSTLDVQT